MNIDIEQMKEQQRKKEFNFQIWYENRDWIAVHVFRGNYVEDLTYLEYKDILVGVTVPDDTIRFWTKEGKLISPNGRDSLRLPEWRLQIDPVI